MTGAEVEIVNDASNETMWIGWMMEGWMVP